MAGKAIVAVEWHLCNRRLRRKYGRIQCRQINRCTSRCWSGVRSAGERSF